MAIFEDCDKPSKENPWKDCLTIAAVGPQGQFVYRHFSRSPDLVNEQIGDVPLRIRDGEPYLAKSYKRAGWCLYEDLCRGAVEGVEPDMVKWNLWQKCIKDHANNRPIPGSTLNERNWLHAEVWRRRDERGMNSVTKTEMQEWLASQGVHPEVDPEEYAQFAEPEIKPKKGGSK